MKEQILKEIKRLCEVKSDLFLNDVSQIHTFLSLKFKSLNPFSYMSDRSESYYMEFREDEELYFKIRFSFHRPTYNDNSDISVQDMYNFQTRNFTPQSL